MAKAKKKTKKKDIKKVLEVLQGSTKFKMDVSLIVLRYDPTFIVKLLSEIAEDIETGKVLQISQGTSAIVMLCEENFAKKVEKWYKPFVIEHKKDLVAFTIMFPKKAMETPGILSFISDLLSKNGVNIIEVIGCYTDITFVINRKDLFKTMDLLGEFIL